MTAIEGEKEIEMAITANAQLETLFFQKDLANTIFLNQIEKQLQDVINTGKMATLQTDNKFKLFR